MCLRVRLTRYTKCIALYGKLNNNHVEPGVCVCVGGGGGGGGGGRGHNTRLDIAEKLFTCLP